MALRKQHTGGQGKGVIRRAVRPDMRQPATRLASLSNFYNAAAAFRLTLNARCFQTPGLRRARPPLRVAPFHSVKLNTRNVYHDNDKCTEGNNIERQYLRAGTA